MRMTEYPEGPRQKSCTPKMCLSGANSEEPSSNHPREAEPEPVSDDPLTSPEDALQAAGRHCDLLREELEMKRENNAELQKTVLAIYSVAKTELEDLKIELATANTTNATMVEKQSQSDRMIANLKQKYEEALKEITVFQQEVRKCHREVEVSQKEVHTLRIELNASHQEVNSVRTELEVAKKELHRLAEDLGISQTILSLNMDLKVSQKELQTLNLEMEVSRQETRSLKAEVRKWREYYKEALNITETAKRDNLRLKKKILI
ncbi:hypothetical protein FKM82_027325 [Ascaphus truei]